MLTTLNPVVINEWPVPFTGRARDPYVVSKDEIWFVGQSTHYLARFKPSSGEFFKRDLDDESGPHNLIVGNTGKVWYAGNLKGYIGRYDPTTDRIKKYPMPLEKAADPHTLIFDKGEKHIWFTVQHGNYIGRLRTRDGKVDLVAVPTRSARPYGIRMAPDGTPWAVLVGTNKLASVNPQTLEIAEVEIPQSGARPRRLEVGDDGRIWYADYARGYLGGYDPDSGAFSEIALPSAERSKPYATALDSRGRVWVVETGVIPNQFVGFDTRSETIVSITPIPSRGGSVRHMDYHAPTNTIWFGTDVRTIGRVNLGAGPLLKSARPVSDKQ